MRSTSTLTFGPILVLSLHSHQVGHERETTDNQGHTASPPDDGCPEQIVLDLIVSPAAHTKSQVQPGPVKRLRSQDIVLVGVGNERVVRGHHRHIEVPKVFPEWRLV